MSKVKMLITKYNVPKAKFKGGKPKFDPSKKWVEYSLDLIEAKSMLQAVDFVTRFDLLKVINKIESKIYYHENHADFDFRSATNDLRSARKLLRM
jgi:hypothetical protein